MINVHSFIMKMATLFEIGDKVLWVAFFISENIFLRAGEYHHVFNIQLNLLQVNMILFSLRGL